MVITGQSGGGGLETFSWLMQQPAEVIMPIFKEAPQQFHIEIASFLQEAGELVPTVLNVVHYEMMHSNTEGELFREDCVTSKFLYGCFYAGKSSQTFFKNTIVPIILQSKKCTVTPEIELERSESNSEPTVLLIMQMIEKLITNISNNIEHCSPYYRFFLSEIRKTVANKFKNEALERNIICSFFFLRLLCPAMVSPKMHNIAVPKYSGFAHDSLKLIITISKVLQAIGNGNVSDSKETWPEQLNEFIIQQQPRVALLFTQLLDITEITNIFAQTPEFQAKHTEHVWNHRAIHFPGYCEDYLREKINEYHLEESMEAAVAILPPTVTHSHPITWSPLELRLWLYKSNHSKLASLLHTYNYCGEKFIHLNRNDLRAMGVVHFAQQSKILQLIRDSMNSFAKFKPNANEKNAQEWNFNLVSRWAQMNKLEEAFVENVARLAITGKQLMTFSPDLLRILGVSDQSLGNALVQIRTLQFSCVFDTVKATQSNLLRRGDTIPSLFDKAVDSWLDNMDVQVKSQPKVTKLPQSPRPLHKYNTDDSVSKDGLLGSVLNRKRGNSKWKSRFFVLDSVQGVLYEFGKQYFEFSRAKLNSIKAGRVYVLSECQSKSADNFEKPFTFIITGMKDPLFLQMNSESSYHKWLTKILEFTSRITVEKLNIEVFDIPSVVAKQSGKICDINSAALTTLKYQVAGDLIGKSIKVIAPTLSYRCIPEGNFKLSLHLADGTVLEHCNAKVASFTEKNADKLLITLTR